MYQPNQSLRMTQIKESSWLNPNLPGLKEQTKTVGITNNQKMVILLPSPGEALPQGKEETSREAARTLQTEISKLC